MKRVVTIIIMILLLFAAVVPVTAAKAAGAPVRVAYFDCGEYYKAQPDGSVVSYDAEYLKVLSEYTGLDFMYVDCGTWDNALKMLENKEVDLLGTMQKNAGREEQYAMCTGSYGVTVTELVVMPDSDIGYRDYASIGKTTLGVTRNYVRMTELTDLFEEYEITPDIRYYDTQEQLLSALERGEVGVIAANSHTLPVDRKVVEKYLYAKMYFATWKGNEALAEQLDEALIHTQLYRPEFQSRLQMQYFPGLMREPYSAAELAFIRALPTLNIYINDGSQPLTYRDSEGNMTGILVELCKMIETETGLRFNYRSMTDKDDTKEETCITVNCPDSGTPKQAFVSDSFFTTDFNLYCRTGRSLETDTESKYRIVLPKNRQSFNDYLEVTYPGCEIVMLDTPEECIREVSAGRADLTMLNYYLVDNICKRKDINNITAVPSRGITLGFVMISEGAEAEQLTKIINKGIACMNDDEKNRIQFTYALNTQPDMTIGYFIKNNAVMVSVVVALLACAVCAAIYTRILAKKNAAIQKANAAKSVFLSTMSHDIRTPMNAIINIAKLAQEDYAEHTGDVVADLKQIDTVSEFLLALLNDVLDMSGIESGKYRLKPEVYKYEEFLGYIESVFVPLCKQKNIRFVCERGSTNLNIYADKVRFNQVFFNLLSNAVKYTPAGGTVTYRVNGNTVSGGHLSCVFEVSDTGCGISDEFQKHMFEPFERENETRTAYQGTGLGLTIAKSIIEQMGGEISFKSKRNEGTTFFVKLNLPLATEEQIAAVSVTESSAATLEGKRILVVDDNNTNILILTRLLAKKKAEAFAAHDGKEAVDMFASSETNSLDMILMDVRMPVMDGLEAARQIRALEREDAKTIPILALTADAFDEDVNDSIKAGMNAHLTKPIDSETLFRKIYQYMK